MMRIYDLRTEKGLGRRKTGAPAGSFAPPVLGPSAPTNRAVFAPTIIGGLVISSIIPLKRRPGDDDLEEPNSGRRPWRHFESTYAPPLIFPPSIPQNRAVFSPNVVGPIQPGTITGPRAVYAPTLNVEQTISISNTVTQQAVYAPVVAFVTLITMPAGPSNRTVFAPVVTGGPQYVVFTSIPSNRKTFVPTVTGGSAGVYVFLSGVDRTGYLYMDSSGLRIQSQSMGRWQATFVLFVGDGSFTPALGQTVLITDFGARVFAGCIIEIKQERQIGTQQANFYAITATDKSGILDHRVVTGKSYLVADTPTWDYADVFRDILSNFANGEGILPDGIPASLGPITADLKFNFPTVTNAFDQTARDSGTVWWVNTYGVMHVDPLINLPAAPFGLTETSGNWRASGGGGNSPAPSMTVTTTTQAYYNKLYAVTNLNVLPGSQNNSGTGVGFTETFDCTVNPNTGAGNPGVVVLLDSGTNQYYPSAIIVSTAIGQVTSVTVNGVSKTVINIQNYAGQSPTGLWVYDPGTQDVDPYFIALGNIPNGATVVINYIPYQINQGTSVAQYGTALNPLNPQGAPLGTCGSGVFEGVIQVQNIGDQPSLNAIAAAELARIGGVPLTVSFQTDFPGLMPGQLINVNVPLSGCNNRNLLITSVSGTYIPPDAALGKGSAFQWDVSCTSILDPGNETKWYERLVARTMNPLPVLQYEAATFVISPGSSVSSGVAIANPYPVQRTGLAIECLWSWATPPVQEDVLVTITRNNVAIIQARLNHAVGANLSTLIPIPASNQLYLYKNDVLNINVSYLVLGSAPTPAAGLTFLVRWAM